MIPIDPNKEFQEYKNFAFNRNMLGVAIGLILATAFQKAVSGISDYLIMPFVNYLVVGTGGDWRTWVAHPVPGMNLEVGRLIGTMIDFVILTLVLYFIWAKIMKRIWPELELDKKEEKPLGVEVIYLKRESNGNWKTL
jgi:large conductance mechanosensitive channel protein